MFQLGSSPQNGAAAGTAITDQVSLLRAVVARMNKTRSLGLIQHLVKSMRRISSIDLAFGAVEGCESRISLNRS
jgi:hypothetical protein